MDIDYKPLARRIGHVCEGEHLDTVTGALCTALAFTIIDGSFTFEEAERFIDDMVVKLKEAVREELEEALLRGRAGRTIDPPAAGCARATGDRQSCPGRAGAPGATGGAPPSRLKERAPRHAIGRGFR